MKNYVKFLTKDLTGRVVEALASDSIHPIDGRLSIENACRIALQVMMKKNVYLGKAYVGYIIYKKGREVYKEIKNEKEKKKLV